MFTLDRHIYRWEDGLRHGPKVWPWWKLLTVTLRRCTHDPPEYFWITPIVYNCWVYTRWGAICLTITERRGVYRRAKESEPCPATPSS